MGTPWMGRPSKTGTHFQNVLAFPRYSPYVRSGSNEKNGLSEEVEASWPLEKKVKPEAGYLGSKGYPRCFENSYHGS